jgi:hypothetical protein
MLQAKLFLIILISSLLVSGSIATWVVVKDNGDNEVSLSDVPDKAKEIPPTGKIKSKKLNELSGIAPARREKEYWGHNDKGNDPKLFRFNDQGQILQTVVLKGIKNDDWEGMAKDREGNLYIAGTGDNEYKKKAYHIYKLPEPEKDVNKVDDVTIYSFKYPGKRQHDCEAIFILKEKIYLIPKEKNDAIKPKIYCLDKLEKKKKITVREIGTLEIQGLVTDAAYSSRHQQLAVLTYSGIAFYRVKEESDLFNPPIHYIFSEFGQCEALCYDGNNLVVTNESGAIWKYPVESFLKQ